MSLANMVRRMGEAGATAEAIAIAMEEIEALQIALEARRSADRDRKRRQRETKKTAIVTGHSKDSHGTVTPISAAVSKERHSNLSSSEPEGSSETDTPRARKADPFPRPEWAPPQVWTDFMANRRKRRMTNSPTAYRGFLADIARIADDEWPPGRLLEHAAAKGWGSINDPRENRNGRQGTNSMGGHRAQPGDGLSPTTRAAERVFGVPFGAGDERRVPQ